MKTDPVWQEYLRKGPASKKVAYKVITSFGINHQMINCLSQLEQIELQLVNKFFYNSAVSRVQYLINVKGWLLFSYPYGKTFSNTAFIYYTGSQ